jgi:hypothetical protein
MQTEAVSRGFIVGTKAEAFDKLNSSKDQEETEAHKGEHNCHQIRPRTRSGPSKLHIQAAAGGERRKRTDLSRQILAHRPIAIGSGRRCTWVNLA